MTGELIDGLAVVTGAGGALGSELSVELAQRGRAVVGIGRSDGPLEATAARVRSAGGTFHALRADLSQPAAVTSVFEEIRRIGPVALLVNNAAVHPLRDIMDETMESFMFTVAVNLGSVMGCTRAALVDMVERGSGRIMNVASFAGGDPLPGHGAYAVSKGAARIFTRSLIADLSARFPRIVINDWMPGILATEMGIPDGLDPAVSARWGAELALWHDPSLTGTIWDRDFEVLPQRSLARRVVDRLRFRQPPQARRLTPASQYPVA